MLRFNDSELFSFPEGKKSWRIWRKMGDGWKKEKKSNQKKSKKKKFKKLKKKNK